MTVAVAVQKNDQLVLAADTLVHFAGQFFPFENCDTEKIFRTGKSILAWSGWALYAELLDAFLSESRPFELDSERAVFRFFVAFWRSMREDYGFMRHTASRSDPPFVDLDSTFLICNRGGIFRISGNMDVTRFKQYTAIGSGSKYALGALRALYEQDLDARELAVRAVEVGIDFDVYCDGKIDVLEVPPEIFEGIDPSAHKHRSGQSLIGMRR